MPATAPLRHLKECRKGKCNTGEIPHATLRKSLCIFEEKVLAKNRLPYSVIPFLLVFTVFLSFSIVLSTVLPLDCDICSSYRQVYHPRQGHVLQSSGTFFSRQHPLYPSGCSGRENLSRGRTNPHASGYTGTSPH